MKKLVYFIQKLQVMSGGFFLAIFLITVVVQMITRFLGITALWTEDVSMYSFIWSVFMGAGAMIMDKRHFAFTAIADSITNEKAKRILSIIIWVFMLLFCLMMFYYGCLITKRFWNYTWIGIPAFKRGPTWLCLPISGGVMVLYAITLIYEDIKALKERIGTSSSGKGQIKVIVIITLFAILAFGYFSGKIPMTIILVAMFMLLIGIGVPIAFSLGMVSFIGINSLPATPNMVVFSKMFNGLNSFTLLAVPLFILAATLMNSGAITDRLIDVCIALVGSVRGGLAHANILISMIFAGISGSSQADTAGVGKILIPAMIAQGYDKETSVGVTAASSTLGSIIPPSILMVVYSGIANVSTGALFLSGLIPGIMLGLAQMGVVVAYGKKKNFPKEKRVPLREVIKKVLKSLPALLTPVILIGGIIFGFFTPTESAAIASVYALIIGLFLYRTLKFSDLPKILMETMKQSSLSLFALSTATALGELLSYYRANTIVQKFFSNVTAKTFVFLLITVAFFIFIGTIMDGVPAMILFVPIILPTAKLLSISPLILGLIIVITLALGLVTPPYGLCLLIASSIANISIERAFKGVLPYFLVSLAVLIILIIFPNTFLAIPKFLFPSVF
ncbi:MAG: TRAP transporter large permease subunit [Fusobacteriaceae bacterium]|jgi:tripartite ATP-independent transporter DctM subunit|nr:TRAP transporter large permease subunit [Fusobacteriaceae bacterium]